MPRRQIPIESKVKKYFYIIFVKFKGEKVVKLGISANVARRVLHQYRNENTNGYLLDIIHVYKCDFPHRVEDNVKYRLSWQGIKGYKQEYFPVEYKDLIVKEYKKAINYLGYNSKEIDLYKLVEEKLAKQAIKDKNCKNKKKAKLKNIQ